MSKVQIEINGEVLELDAGLLKAYRDESFEYLKEEAVQKLNFKDGIEAQSETLGIDKKLWSKYVKSAFKAKTKEARELGTAFAALDEATEEVLKIEKEDTDVVGG